MIGGVRNSKACATSSCAKAVQNQMRVCSACLTIAHDVALAHDSAW